MLFKKAESCNSRSKEKWVHGKKKKKVWEIIHAYFPSKRLKNEYYVLKVLKNPDLKKSV